jgi:hypothetical protein
MKKKKEYQEIRPGESWFKSTLVKTTLYLLGLGIQEAYNLEPKAKKEMDSLPDPFTFSIGIHDSFGATVQKKGNKVKYLRVAGETLHPDVELRFKNLEYAYLAMTGRMSTPNLVYHNRQYVKGDLNYMMAMIRVMNIAQTLLFPNTIVRFYIKKVPRLTIRTMVNRVVAYINIFGLSAFK